jgi:hypothetical protein
MTDMPVSLDHRFKGWASAQRTMRPLPRDPIQLEMDAGGVEVIADCATSKGFPNRFLGCAWARRRTASDESIVKARSHAKLS